MNGASLLSSSVLAAAALAPGAGRPLLLLERTMYREGRTPFTSVFPIQVTGEMEERRLRQALARVQARHPLLRCVVEEGAGGPRFVPVDQAAPIRLRIVERSGEQDWQSVVRQEWAEPFDAAREPLVRVVWVRGEGVNELVLFGHHCICDGQSGIGLVRDLLAACDWPEGDLGVYDAPGAMEDLVPAALLEDRHFQGRVRRKALILRLTLFLKRWSGNRRGGSIPAETVYFHRWNTGRAATQTLTERCRAEGVTVLAAVSIAFMQAFRDVRGVRSLGKVSAMVNARRFLPALRSDALFGLAPGITLRSKGLSSEQEMSTDLFWARSRAVKSELNRRIERFGASFYETLAGLETLHDRYDSVVAFFENAPAIPNLTLSNLGRLNLPGNYRSFTLQKIYSPLVMVSPTPANTIVMSSFAGEMEFAFISDEQSLPCAQAREIRQRAMEILRICAGLPEAERV